MPIRNHNNNHDENAYVWFIIRKWIGRLDHPQSKLNEGGGLEGQALLINIAIIITQTKKYDIASDPSQSAFRESYTIFTCAIYAGGGVAARANTRCLLIYLVIRSF